MIPMNYRILWRYPGKPEKHHTQWLTTKDEYNRIMENLIKDELIIVGTETQTKEFTV